VIKMSQLMTVPDIVRGVEPECLQLVTSHNAVNWQAEANYAMQLLSANQYAMGVAVKNPVSVQNALRNAAAIGISLNPTSKNAYLVPRSGGICLDISYMGLLHLAMTTGSIEWGQSKLVYASDTYENLGIDQAPSHKYNAFGQRGELVGAYCVIRTSTGAYLTEEMSIDQLNSIKMRSESGKQNKGPWFTDFEEMCRKTVVKRASKTWPKVDRLHDAIEYLNTDGGEGINHSEPVRDVSPISPDNLEALREFMNKSPDLDRFMSWLEKGVKRKVIELSELTNDEALRALAALRNGGKK
jgi:recombination protein RecT